MFVVFNGMQMMAMRDLGVMRRLFMIARFVMFCGLAMVLRGLLMMVRRLLMVLVDCVFRHVLFLIFCWPDVQSIAVVGEIFATAERFLHAIYRAASRFSRNFTCTKRQ
jgi:hypothetical protein